MPDEEAMAIVVWGVEIYVVHHPSRSRAHQENGWPGDVMRYRRADSRGAVPASTGPVDKVLTPVIPTQIKVSRSGRVALTNEVCVRTTHSVDGTQCHLDSL